MSQTVIWIVEDDTSIRWVLNKALEKLKVEVVQFESAEQANRQLQHSQPDVIVTDIRMPGTSGLDWLDYLHQQHPQIPVIVMTAYSDLKTTVKAFRSGAFDYLSKPFDINTALSVIEKAAEHAQQKTTSTKTPLIHKGHHMIGESAAIQKIFTAIGRLSHADINVLLCGESGTGKELVAMALHENSPRSKKPFIAINTAAIPTELLESELFGHEKGAFTGAHARRQGRFEQANNGTLFLDEIGDMPVALQTRLLRVLQDGKFYRVGGHELIQSDVRIIAATNQDLAALVKAGKFRDDLYHRLNVIQLQLPALRERADDISLLANHFLNINAQELKVEPKLLTDQAILQLTSFDWPGNIRQLENTCRWLMVMSPAKTIQASDLPEDIFNTNQAATGNQAMSWQTLLAVDLNQRLIGQQTDILDYYNAQMEQVVFENTLNYTHGHKINAAQILGCGRNTITRKLKELKLGKDA